MLAPLLFSPQSTKMLQLRFQGSQYSKAKNLRELHFSRDTHRHRHTLGDLFTRLPVAMGDSRAPWDFRNS
jgi:hypothetical protein